MLYVLKKKMIGTGADVSESYDLRKMEDIFACLEVITMARGALYPVDANLANRLEKVSDALSAFSLVINEGPSQSLTTDSSPPQQPSPQKQFSFNVEDGNGVEPIDLMSDFPQTGKSGSAEVESSPEDDGIIDILTGEKIK